LEADWWGYDHEDVQKHYPPQLIIGKQVEKEN